MKRYIIIAYVLIALGLTQTIGYYSFGKRAIHIAIMKNLQTYALDVERVGVYSPYIDLTDKEKRKIADALNFKVVEFTDNPKSFSEQYRHSEKGYGLGYEIDELGWTAEVMEYNGALEYGEEWRSRFVWILFGWVQIEHENIGQS